MVVCVVATIAAMIWLGSDIFLFLRGGGAVANVPRRLLYVLLSETGKPVFPLIIGTFLATLIAQRLHCSEVSPVAASE